MLRKLLFLAVGQDMGEVTALAREMGVSVRQVVQMIESLERLGYLEEVVTGCGQPCERCPLHESCLFQHRPRLWMLTRRAEKFLATFVVPPASPVPEQFFTDARGEQFSSVGVARGLHL
jgi:hypothetical protein